MGMGSLLGDVPSLETRVVSLGGRGGKGRASNVGVGEALLPGSGF
jgi:hypothetical protein